MTFVSNIRQWIFLLRQDLINELLHPFILIYILILLNPYYNAVSKWLICYFIVYKLLFELL